MLQYNIREWALEFECDIDLMLSVNKIVQNRGPFIKDVINQGGTRCLGRGAKKQHPKKAVYIKAAFKKAVPELAVVKKQHL